MNIWDLATGWVIGFVLGLVLSPNRSLARVPRLGHGRTPADTLSEDKSSGATSLNVNAAGESSVELADEQTLRIIAQMDAEYKAAMQKWGAN